MFAVIGPVRLKPGREQEALAMIGERGVAMVHGMSGSAGRYWWRARPRAGDPALLLALRDGSRRAQRGGHRQDAAHHARSRRGVRQRRRLRGRRVHAVSDVNATIQQADEDMVLRLADVLELRAADLQQRAMLEDYLVDLPLPPGACSGDRLRAGTDRWRPGGEGRRGEVLGIDPSPL